MKREERERIDYIAKFCMNIGGKFKPIKELCPDREIYDKLMEEYEKEIKKRQEAIKDSMSNVARRYL